MGAVEGGCGSWKLLSTLDTGVPSRFAYCGNAIAGGVGVGIVIWLKSAGFVTAAAAAAAATVVIAVDNGSSWVVIVVDATECAGLY